MNGYQVPDLSSNIENSRNSLRRIAVNEDAEFSRESIVKLIEKFVKAVNVMDDTILVPSRLMDRSVGDANDSIAPEASLKHHHYYHHHHHHHHSGENVNKKVPVHEALNAAELFKLYNMLNSVKTDLLWGQNNTEQPDEDMETVQENEATSTPTTVSVAATSTNTTDDNKDCKGHARRPSTASVASSNSATTISDSDSDISTENDSGIESECKPENDKSSDLAKKYRKHLLGLYRCLEQMTDAASYLTTRYQSDIGPV